MTACHKPSSRVHLCNEGLGGCGNRIKTPWLTRFIGFLTGFRFDRGFGTSVFSSVINKIAKCTRPLQDASRLAPLLDDQLTW